MNKDNLINLGFRGAIFIAIAVAFAVLKGDEPMAWTVIATYGLTGVCLALGGYVMDLRAELAKPKKLTALLRHEKRAWLLTVFMTPTGELYASDDEELRMMTPIDQDADLPRDVLGSPHYTPLESAGTNPRFRILGRVFYSY